MGKCLVRNNYIQVAACMSKRESRGKCALNNDCMQVVACSNEGIWKRMRGKQSLYTSSCLPPKNIGSKCVGSSQYIQVVACRQKTLGANAWEAIITCEFVLARQTRNFGADMWEAISIRKCLVVGQNMELGSECVGSNHYTQVRAGTSKHGTWERMCGKQSLHAGACLHVKTGL